MINIMNVLIKNMLLPMVDSEVLIKDYLSLINIFDKYLLRCVTSCLNGYCE